MIEVVEILSDLIGHRAVIIKAYNTRNITIKTKSGRYSVDTYVLRYNIPSIYFDKIMVLLPVKKEEAYRYFSPSEDVYSRLGRSPTKRIEYGYIKESLKGMKGAIPTKLMEYSDKGKVRKRIDLYLPKWIAETCYTIVLPIDRDVADKVIKRLGIYGTWEPIQK